MASQPTWTLCRCPQEQPGPPCLRPDSDGDPGLAWQGGGPNDQLTASVSQLARGRGRGPLAHSCLPAGSRPQRGALPSEPARRGAAWQVRDLKPLPSGPWGFSSVKRGCGAVLDNEATVEVVWEGPTGVPRPKAQPRGAGDTVSGWAAVCCHAGPELQGPVSPGANRVCPGSWAQHCHTL